MTRGEGARAGRSYQGEARSATAELAMNTETESVVMESSGLGREEEKLRRRCGWWLHAQSFFKPVLLRIGLRGLAGSCVTPAPATCVTVILIHG